MSAFVDLQAEDVPDDLEADVCIVGAGAAGITMALELTRSDLSVILLESGGAEMDGPTQFLYAGSNSGLRYPDLAAVRLRYFGGSTNHWGGHTNYLSKQDLEGIPSAGILGWPIEQGELMPYFERAAEQLAIDFTDYEPRKTVAGLRGDPDELVEQESSVFESTSFLRTPRRKFAVEFGDQLKASPTTSVFLHANLSHIQLLPNGRAVDYLQVKSLGGKSVRVRAKAHVLACHAIENARLLLASNDIQKEGIGNQSDQVGRNFMDHVYLETGKLLTSMELFPEFYMRNPRQRGDTPRPEEYGVVVSLTGEERRRNQMLSYYANFGVHYADEELYDSLSMLKETFMEPGDAETIKAIGSVLINPMSTSRLVAEEANLREREIAYLALHQRIDQAPNPSSRVTLKEERDALGLPTVNLHWDITDLDVHSFQRGQDLMVRELSAIGFGRFVTNPITDEFVRENLRVHYHNMGTTRMSASASTGVVDGNCRLHNVDNLYVAGSSVFPNGGGVGPTFSIVALAIRLSDHLKSSYQ